MKTNIILLLLVCAGTIRAQQALTLGQVVDMARQQSIAARQAATSRETRSWEYRSFLSNYKPQLVLTGRLPAFSRSFIEVLQPDGTILFQPVRNNNSSAGVSLEQNIARTGGTIYATTQLQRFDDFERKNTLYNSTLFAVGMSQPLFGFNALRWDRKIEPLRYQESRQEYLENLEYISMQANGLYFDLLLAKVNRNIADTNLVNTERILRIAREKFDIGITSRNEILQLQLEQVKAQKAVAAARRDEEIATLNLKSYIGLQDGSGLQLSIPQQAEVPALSAERLIAEAFSNRADAIGFSRRMLEAERAVAKARGDNGLNASLALNLGFSNRGQQLRDVAQSPQNYQTVELQFTMPILDWGRAQARGKTAEAARQLTQQTVEQDKLNFQQEIVTAVTLFDMLQNQLALTARADSIASEKYQIAQERYILGNLGITDLSIAFSEKDQAKRDFIGALRDYWAAYYRLRWLTLFDIEKNIKIQ